MQRFVLCVIAIAAWLGDPQPSWSQGTIVFRQPTTPILLWNQGFDQFLPFDLDEDGSHELTFVYNFQSIGVRNDNGARSLSFVNPPPDSYADPQPLPAGFLIGPDSGSGQVQWFGSYPPPINFNTLVFVVNIGTSGQFAGQHAYMGVEFQRGGATHYGWMLLQISSDAAIGQIESWAWDTRPGAAIFAGAVPEPSTWMLLALGGAFMFWQSRQSVRAL